MQDSHTHREDVRGSLESIRKGNGCDGSVLVLVGNLLERLAHLDLLLGLVAVAHHGAHTLALLLALLDGSFALKFASAERVPGRDGHPA